MCSNRENMLFPISWYQCKYVLDTFDLQHIKYFFKIFFVEVIDRPRQNEDLDYV